MSGANLEMIKHAVVAKKKFSPVLSFRQRVELLLFSGSKYHVRTKDKEVKNNIVTKSQNPTFTLHLKL